MLEFEQLWYYRFKRFAKHLGKHLKVIMNDHFTVILFVILGFFMLFYREQLKALQNYHVHDIKLPVISIVGFLLSVAPWLGQPMWLMKEADRSFVFSRGHQWEKHWRKGSIAGAIIPVLINCFLVTGLLPILMLVLNFNMFEILGLVLMQVMAVVINHLLQYVKLFSINLPTYLKIVSALGYFIVLVSGFYFWGAKVTIVIASILIFIYVGLLRLVNKEKAKWLNFQYAIDLDLERQNKINKRLSFFVDIPEVQNSMVERNYLNPLIQFLSRKVSSPMEYALIRVLFRNKAFSGIWMRLLLFTCSLIPFSSTLWMTAALGIVSLYLTVVQLLPIANHFDYHPLFAIYPKQNDQALKAVQKLLRLILIIQCLFFTLLSLLAYFDIRYVGVLFLVWVLIAGLLVYLYVPYKQK